MPFLKMKRSDRYRRRRVPTDWLQNLDLGLHSDFPELFRYKKPMFVVGNDDWSARSLDTLQAQHRFLKHGAPGNERQELLRQEPP